MTLRLVSESLNVIGVHLDPAVMTFVLLDLSGFVVRRMSKRTAKQDPRQIVEAMAITVEALSGGGDLLQLHRDTPTRWDAWDIDEHCRRHGVDVTDVVSLDIVPHPSAAIVCVVRELGGGHGSRRL